MLAAPPLHCARFRNEGVEFMQRGKYVIPFSQLRMTDVESVGGKNASLGEMLSQLSAAGVRVPDGFATTAEAFRLFLEHGKLRDRIAQRLAAAECRRCSSARRGGRGDSRMDRRSAVS